MHRINWVLENCISAKRNAGDPWLLSLDPSPASNEKRHICRSSVNMADELIQQAQELFEGQIVGCCSVSGLYFED